MPESTVKRNPRLTNFAPPAWMASILQSMQAAFSGVYVETHESSPHHEGHKGQRSKAVARRRMRNKMASKSRRINRMVA